MPTQEQPKNPFKKAVKEGKKARIILKGTSGSGKTRSALEIAKALSPNKKIALVDTEKGSSKHYADLADFDMIDYNDMLKNNHTPNNYLKLVEVAEKAGYEVLIIDSFSHVWMGNNGILDIVDNYTNTKYNGNSFRAWNDGNKLYQSLIDKIILGNDMHIILTARAKQEYELTGGKVVKKGLKMEQRDGLDFEVDMVLDFNIAKPGFAVSEKDRTRTIPAEGLMIDSDGAKVIADYFSK